MAHYKGDANDATRAMHISKRREKAKEELEEKRKKVEGDVKLSTIDNQFAAHSNSIEAHLKSSTVGLVTLDQMRQKQEDAIKERERQLAQNIDDGIKIGLEQSLKKSVKANSTKSLSFYDDDDEDDEDDRNSEDESHVEPSDSPDKPNKNVRDLDSGGNTSPDRKKSRLSWDQLEVDTSLLPDRDREEEERKLRERLAAEWRERQLMIRNETIEITFSYFDGTGHRYKCLMKKGDSIHLFLSEALKILRKDFDELRSVSANQMMFIKEDLILPTTYTFYDFIVTKARGKSGPLFDFGVHEDVRLTGDATVETSESHAGKVLTRSYYERNKHVFPLSRWENFDPTKSYDQKYTIR